MASPYQAANSTVPCIQLAPMPQLAEATSREDDWTGTKDAAARRRAQTRLNTRAYRKRKAEAKRAGAPNGTAAQPEALVECWDDSRQSVAIVPASRIRRLYNARRPLFPPAADKPTTTVSGGGGGVVMFPLSADHLITLLQFNALRALAVNRTLLSGALATPLDCGGGEEVIRVTPYPDDPGRLPPALLPTALQRTVPHADWVDVFPCPAGRDRLILAAGTFDEDELWDDCVGGLFDGFPDDEVARRGLIAWSPPWDIAGWEMSEGFLRKWGWLLKGSPAALEATNRWRRQRCEEPLC
ncbi:hypothetical protein SAMD00023353_13100060 [Rosellinia necatrix]|uniref:BZIP domain-containing protein n=1 Tax=Rosellinia necatrix TaxID=77044 RepID=A0A1S7ULL0_ROSNE|nr:hypothetical protein SAMD00023353_13100060 [Rosellinia necatrix]